MSQSSLQDAALSATQRIPVNTLPVFSSLAPLICQRLLRLAKKDDSDRLLVHADGKIHAGNSKKRSNRLLRIYFGTTEL